MPISIIQSSNWVDVVAALGTAAAAVFAAYSAWTSRVSARAARDAVNEAKLARQLELEPKLILEKDFLDLQFVWPHKDTLNGEAVYLARKHWRDNLSSPPAFKLQNFGQSPALEVTIEWSLETENSFELPARLKANGMEAVPATPQEPGSSPKYQLNFHNLDGSIYGVPLYLKWTTDLANCAPGQPREVEFPMAILNSLFGKALGGGSQGSEIVVNAKLHFYSIDGSIHISQFRWKSIPFWHGQIAPVVAHSHFIELPVRPKPEGPRVA
ncbi:hypothetical protein ACODUO_05720 [Stenotrophomonas maltophilia]|uniref:hypothetical protein n=1 Tax=Stenotrophomonas maltophilia TaxID=40324 RepID=UPI0039C28E9B